MAYLEEKRVILDPSVNVQQLVGNAVKYLEQMHEMGQKFNDEKLRLAIESSQRERLAESERINALRRVDVDAVSVANDRAIKQAELLNSQMLDNAEVLRKSVEATANTIATQFEKMTIQMNDRIAALERVNSENSGRSSASPDLQELVTQLINSQNVAKGVSTGNQITTAKIFGIIAATGTIVSILVVLANNIFK